MVLGVAVPSGVAEPAPQYGTRAPSGRGKATQAKCSAPATRLGLQRRGTPRGVRDSATALAYPEEDPGDEERPLRPRRWGSRPRSSSRRPSEEDSGVRIGVPEVSDSGGVGACGGTPQLASDSSWRRRGRRPREPRGWPAQRARSRSAGARTASGRPR